MEETCCTVARINLNMLSNKIRGNKTSYYKRGLLSFLNEETLKVCMDLSLENLLHQFSVHVCDLLKSYSLKTSWC